MAYKTVGEVIAQVRVLLEDTDTALQRYSDDVLIQQLNAGLLDSRRIRPDLFRSTLDDVPQYTVNDIVAGTELAYEQMFVPTLVYYVTGLAQLSDSEEDTDQRATVLIGAFDKKLTSTP